MFILPITLTIAGAAALVNLWLAIRIGRVRAHEKTWVGDGGHPLLLARMRAQANFVEYTPIVLILIGLIELARGTSTWLWVVGALYVIVRICHGFGMDGGRFGKLRNVGAVATLLLMLGLALYALYIPYMPASPTMTDIAAIG